MKSMKSNKGINTGPELLLRQALRSAGYPGYRVHWKVPGKPDISYPGMKIAIFVNGCFWHRCPYCNIPIPKTHTDYWIEKFERNTQRDSINTKELQKMGWTVLVVWECEINGKIDEVVSRIACSIEQRRLYFCYRLVFFINEICKITAKRS
ncbi:very short patch repair endonuclease [Candidatus Methanoplasma termitum]|uniref:very short patch repair endonuclease n=1 Tax=Candidatus Methanoplasma termitum TaxID=1577791 RepID=UPI00373AE86B